MKKSIARDDRGFSLVELLIAIAMLGIIAAPLLHAFVTSAQTARKSYDMGELTLAAQTAAEQVEADNTVVRTAAAYIEANPSESVYTYTISDVGGKGKFDAKVTLDPTPYASTVNSVEITQYSPMDAVFSQTGGGADPDAEGKDQLLALAAGYEGGTLNEAITRTITINIVESGVNYTYSCAFNYAGTVSYKDGGKDTSASVNCKVEYPSFYAGVKGATENVLSPLYFFFVPGSSDKITVTHTGDGNITPLNVFLAAQKTFLTPNTYMLMVDLKDKGVTNSEYTISKIYSNVELGKYIYRVYISQVWYQRSSLDGTLVETKQVDRMFDVTIDICARDTDTVLYTLDSGKLD